jgi:hypothetical protein
LNDSCHYSTMGKSYKPKNYKQGTVYDIRCKKTGRVYVGSRGTTEKARMQKHRRHLVQYKENGHVYCGSSLILENGQYEVHTLESYPCKCDVDVCTSDECRRRLNRKEGEYIRQYKEKFGELCVNNLIAGRTVQERYVETFTHRQKKAKERYVSKKKEIRKRVSAPETCQLCGTITRHDTMPKHMRSCFKSSCDSMNLIEI